MTLELEWQKAEQERQEDTHQHEPPEVEFGFYNQVQQGDVDAVQENLRSGLYRQIAAVAVSLYCLSVNGIAILY